MIVEIVLLAVMLLITFGSIGLWLYSRDEASGGFYFHESGSYVHGMDVKYKIGAPSVGILLPIDVKGFEDDEKDN